MGYLNGNRLEGEPVRVRRLTIALSIRDRFHAAHMDPRIYYFLHVFSIILLTGFTFAIAANPQKGKKKLMAIVTGALALVAFVGGFGLMAKLHNNDFAQGWVITKIIAWLFVSALGGLAYKKSKSFVQTGLIVAIAVSLYMVYFRPF